MSDKTVKKSQIQRLKFNLKMITLIKIKNYFSSGAEKINAVLLVKVR